VNLCPQCGAAFNPATPRQKWCTSKCQVQSANARRQTTRAGRRDGLPKAVPANKATVANLLGQWFVRVDGWLALGPMSQAQAQARADRLNNKETTK
jgi:hypothetical protein